MGSRSMYRHLWGLPLAAGLVLAHVSCSGTDHYYAVGNPAIPTTFATTADLNGDGKVDIVDSIYLSGGGVASSGFISARIQSATAGSYLDPVQSNGGPNPSMIVAAKLSPTGNPGVVAVNTQLVYSATAANTVSVLYPDPANPGGFLAPVSLPVGSRNPLGVAVGDLNGDTWPDVVVAADSASTVLVFYQATSGGTFGVPTALTVGGEPTAVAVADVNGDGLLDIVATTSAGNVSVLIQNPDHSFQPHVDYTVGTLPSFVQVADLRGTGRKDLIVANQGSSLTPTSQGLSVLLQNPDNTYAQAVTYDTGNAYASCVAVGDLNKDGMLDIAVANFGVPGNPGSVSVFLQDPANPGAFLPAVNYQGLQGPTSVAIADIDGDGYNDLVLGDGNLFVRYQVATMPGTFSQPYGFRE